MRVSVEHKKSSASVLIRPDWKTLSPNLVTCRSSARMRVSPEFTSAANIRTELLPISTAAYRGISVLYQPRHRLAIEGGTALRVFSIHTDRVIRTRIRGP